MILKTSIASFHEAALWCSRAEPISVGFRSEVLRPPTPLLDEPGGFLIDHGHEAVGNVVADLCNRRRELLHLNMPRTEMPGRILVTTAIEESVVDGAASAASSGWFDGNDLPPWDTWFAYARLNTRRFTERETLFSFVPWSSEAAAEQGLKVNPVDCIEWATEEDLRALEVALRRARPA